MPHSPDHMNQGAGEARDSNVQNVMNTYGVEEHNIDTFGVGHLARRGKSVLNPANIQKNAVRVARTEGDTAYGEDGGAYHLKEGTFTGVGANPSAVVGKLVNFRGRTDEATNFGGKSRRTITGWNMSGPLLEKNGE